MTFQNRCGSGRVGPGIPCDGGCQPHGIAYEPYSMELKDWLFVNLSWRRTAGEEQPDRGRRGSRPPGQVLAVKVGDLEEQYVMYADESGYEPLDLEVVNFPFQVRQP